MTHDTAKLCAITTSQYDEGLATMRDALLRSDPRAVLQLHQHICTGMESGDDREAFTAGLALVGFCAAVLAAAEKSEVET